MTIHLPLNIVLLSKHLSVVPNGNVEASKVRTRMSPERQAKTTGRNGGKPAGKVLSKPVKPTGKRAEFLRYFISSPNGRSVYDCMKRFDMKRPNVFAYWTAIHKDHAIGYSLEGGVIRAKLPPKHNLKTIFGVK